MGKWVKEHVHRSNGEGGEGRWDGVFVERLPGRVMSCKQIK